MARLTEILKFHEFTNSQIHTLRCRQCLGDSLRLYSMMTVAFM